jgi:hypothetical protein
MLGTLGILFYLFPTIVAFILRRAVPDMRIGVIFAANVLLGWTGIGWFGVLVYVIYRVLKNASRSGALPGEWERRPAGPTPTPPIARPKCECSHGQMRCPQCQGRQGDYINGAWHSCRYCTGSGTVQCTHCDGSGYLTV